jgi:hypothetical protein
LTAGGIAVASAAVPTSAYAAVMPPGVQSLSGTGADATAALTSYLASAGATASIVGDYVIDGELVVPHTVTSLEIPAGSRLVVRGDHAGLARRGTVAFRELLPSAVSAGSTGFAVATPTKYRTGEYILVTTYDVVPNSPDKYGYLRQVTGVAAGRVQVDGALPRALTLQPRTAAIALAPALRIWGGGQISSTDPKVSTQPLVTLFAVSQPVVEGVEIFSSGGTGVAVAHCLGGKIDCSIHDLLDDGVNYFGYGVNVLGATRGLTVLGTMSRVRHAVTTNAGPSITGIGPAGEPEDCHFEPVVSDCTDKSVDTHRVGWNTTIVPHITGGRGGVQVRADNTHVVGGSIIASSGPGIAISNVVTLAGSVSGVAISYLQPSGTALLCNGPVAVSDVSIRDCYGTNIVLASNSTVRGGSISAGSSVGVQFNGSYNSVDGLQLGESVTTPYIEAAGVTGNTFTSAAPTDIEKLPAPYSVTVPAIAGIFAVGQQVQSSAGKWNITSPLTYTYSWYRDGVAIGGASARTHPKYDVVSADLGKRLTVKVTADRAGYAQGSATSAPSEAVAAGAALVATTPPATTGTLAVGSYIQVSNGAWNPAAQSWSYQWLVDGVAVSGLVANRVQIQSAWAGKSVVARVTAKRTGWTNGTADAAAVRMPGAAIRNTVLPVITGTPKVGSYVSVSGGSWDPYVSTKTYQWFVDGVLVTGLTANRVQVRSAWAGKKLKARVTATKAGWTTATADSAAVAVAATALQNTVRPVISGTTVVGNFITTSKGSWTPSATSWAVAWYVDGVVVPNLNVLRVQVRSAWKGKSVVAKVTASAAGLTSTSSSTLPVVIS